MSNNNRTPTLSAASALERPRRYPIIINVYDLNEINDYTYNFGLGIFHSGVHVHNKEWSFGGHEFPTSGCFYCEPKAVPPPAKFRISQCVGFTTKSEREVERIVRVLGAEEFLGDRYHLLLRNCNHFVERLIEELVDESLEENQGLNLSLSSILHGNNSSENGVASKSRFPSWINRLARVAVVTNRFAPCLLPVAIRQIANVPAPGQFSTIDGNNNDEDDDVFEGGEAIERAVLIAPGNQRM